VLRIIELTNILFEKLNIKAVAGFKSGLYGNASIYVVSNLLNATAPFLLLPILTRHLSPYEYGLVAIFQVVLAFASAVVGLNINGAITRQYFKQGEVDLPQYVYACTLILVVSTLVLLATTIGLSSPLSRLTQIPPQWLWTIILCAASQFLINTLLSLWQASSMPIRYGIFQAFYLSVNLISTLVLVTVAHLGWEGRVIAQVFASFIFGCISLILIIRHRWIVPKFNVDYIRNALSFGVPLIPHAASAAVLMLVDRAIIGHVLGLESAGIYAVAAQVSMVVIIIQNSLNQAWVPWLYKRLAMKDKEVNLKVVKTIYAFLVIFPATALCLGAIAPVLIGFLIGPQYASSAPLVTWIALGYSFNGMYKLMTNFIFYAEKTHYLGFTTMLSAFLYIPSVYIATLNFGLAGAGVSVMVNFALMFLVVWLVSSKVYKMPYRLQ
jgi:O-antigen/teichoic acid export membrane protein